MATQLVASRRSLSVVKRSTRTYRSAAFQPIRSPLVHISKHVRTLKAAEAEDAAAPEDEVQQQDEVVQEDDFLQEDEVLQEDEILLEETLPADLESLSEDEQIAAILRKLEVIQRREGSDEPIVIDLSDEEAEGEAEVELWDQAEVEAAANEYDVALAEELLEKESSTTTDEEKLQLKTQKEYLLNRIQDKIEEESNLSMSEVKFFLAANGLSLDDLPQVELTESTRRSYGKDYEVENIITPEEKEALESYKLSKSELKSLIPQDWDTVDIDWLGNKKVDRVVLPEYKLNILWLEKNIAVAVDQVYGRGQTSPLTEYFFWPRKDAWEELKVALEARPWVPERDRVVLLNRVTEVINYWQDEEIKHGVDDARQYFPDCSFAGA